MTRHALARAGCKGTRRALVVAAPAVAFALAALFLPGAALAQAPPEQLKEAVVGPYRIAVIARPPRPVEGLGGPRFTVDVASASTGMPVTDADVTIALAGPKGESGEVKLSPNPSDRRLYEGRVTLEAPGVWAWKVAVSSPLGIEVLDGAITVVQGPSSGRAGLIAWVLMLLALLALFGLAYRNLRPRPAPSG